MKVGKVGRAFKYELLPNPLRKLPKLILNQEMCHTIFMELKKLWGALKYKLLLKWSLIKESIGVQCEYEITGTSSWCTCNLYIMDYRKVLQNLPSSPTSSILWDLEGGSSEEIKIKQGFNHL